MDAFVTRDLLPFLASVPDPRSRHGRQHPLSAILALVCCAILCGARSYAAIAQWAEDQDITLMQRLGFTRRTPKMRGATTWCSSKTTNRRSSTISRWPSPLLWKGLFPPRQQRIWDNAMDTVTTLDKGHGRRERRTLKATTALNEYLDWPGVAQVGQVESDVVKDGKTTHETRYFITSVSRAVADAGQLLKWTRGTGRSRIVLTRPTIPGWDTNRLIALLELPGFAGFATTREVLSMPGKTAKVTITERQQDILRTIQNAPTVSSQLRQRAAIILLAFDRQDNPQIAAQVGLSRRQVSLWRRRWADAWDRLIRIECLESHAALRRAIEQVLRDEPRPGPPGKFTPEQIVQILAVACEPPEKSGRPITHWTAHELADEVVKRGIVPSISVAQVGRYLREAALQPHKKRYWLNTTEKDPVQFQKQVEAVCDTYLEAPALEQNQRTHTVSSDEMTGLLALERNAPSRPMTFGQCEKIEFEYTRHGTLTLIGNFQVTTGELIAPTIGPTRTEADFASHIEQTVATDPKASWIFVVDNLNIHGSETLVRKVAQACGIEQPLGKKGVRGVLKSVASRQAFLSEKSHRIRFVYTPKHSSWLNQIETIFGMIMRKVIRRGSFTSVKDLRDKLLNFIEYFNRVFAKPFQWTYTGRPLRAKPAA